MGNSMEILSQSLFFHTLIDVFFLKSIGQHTIFIHAISNQNNSSWFGFKNTGDVSTGNTTNDRGIVTIDLGGQAEITGTQAHIFAGDNDAGAVQPAYMNVYILTFKPGCKNINLSFRYVADKLVFFVFGFVFKCDFFACLKLCFNCR